MMAFIPQNYHICFSLNILSSFPADYMKDIKMSSLILHDVANVTTPRNWVFPVFTSYFVQ
jgi:hypothetical protein